MTQRELMQIAAIFMFRMNDRTNSLNIQEKHAREGPLINNQYPFGQTSIYNNQYCQKQNK